jgi:signal transduction histidine kinase/ActR/RegA family two-component response regulator
VFGVQVAARREVNGFTSAEGEFLRMLSEHVALAASQARLHQNLQQAYDELRQTQQAVLQQERLRALGQMASGIAHDINNTLSPVVGFPELLLAYEPNLSERTQQYLTAIKTAGEDLTHTVARLREFYRPRDEQDILLPTPLNRLVRQVIELTRPRWKDIPQERGVVVEMRTDLQEDLPPVMGLESDLREALTNLLFNAVDAMPQGGTITIRTSVECRVSSVESTAAESSPVTRHPSPVTLSVSDTGVGMDEETRQRCLDPFFSTKSERGTGLGLAMVYGTIQRHEGEIEIESALGQGTTMRLIFPLREAARAGVASPQATRPLSPLRILCIDDEPLLRMLMKEMLESDGHTVEVADGGKAGLEAFRSAQARGEPFEVVITDLGMPYMDGREVARTVKGELPTTPVILLTGWGMFMRAEGDLPAQVDRVLSKPPRINDLRQALAQVTQPPF